MKNRIQWMYCSVLTQSVLKHSCPLKETNNIMTLGSFGLKFYSTIPNLLIKKTCSQKVFRVEFHSENICKEMSAAHTNAVLLTLCKQLEHEKNNHKQYKNLYRAERDENRWGIDLNNQLQHRNRELEQEHNQLHDQLEDLENHIKAFRFPRVYKKYNELTSPVGKAKRRSLFKRCIEQSLVHITEIKHATVNLRIGSKDVELFWSENELHNLRWIAKNIVGDGPVNDATVPENAEDTEISKGNNEADPFLSDGKWNPIHVRKIVHVMDAFHISMEAYHELRSASLSVLPPLYVVKIHKESMSWDINFTTDHQVSIELFSKIFTFLCIYVFVMCFS